jgi:thiol:disulfide interchange protein
MPAFKVPFVLAMALAAVSACGVVGTGGRPEVVPPAPPVSASPAELPRAYDPKADASAEIAAALAKARADGRPVLLDFGARWCPECADLHHIFRHDAVRPLLDGYRVVTIDVGRIDRNLGLARKYGVELKRTGIPALVVLSPEGEVRVAGNESLYPASSREVLLLENVAAFLRRWR